MDPALAEAIRSESSWRKRYLVHLRRLVEAGARSSDAAVAIAHDGLRAVQSEVEVTRDGRAFSPRQALHALEATGFETAELHGDAEPSAPQLSIPYRGEVLRGDDLRRQLDRWVEGRIIEPSSAQAVEKVVANPEWLDLSDRTFVLLGAASEMGALAPLLRWGATVAAVDLPRPRLWERVVGEVQRGTGKLLVPIRRPLANERDVVNVAGADLLAETPEIHAWLRRLSGPLTVADDTYADGTTFLLLAAATDSLIAELTASRPDASLAYLATPTDVFAVDEEIADAPLPPRRVGMRTAGRGVTAGALFRPSYRDRIEGEEGRRWGIVDCLVPQQGPNYALAKTIQRWRATAARSDGIQVSANVAPATRTRSVTKNRILAAAYRGAAAYGVEIFESPTSRWLMAALLVHDLRDPETVDGEPRGGHPYDLYVRGAAHGGIWRLPYEPRSVLPLAVLRGVGRRK